MGVADTIDVSVKVQRANQHIYMRLRTPLDCCPLLPLITIALLLLLSPYLASAQPFARWEPSDMAAAGVEVTDVASSGDGAVMLMAYKTIFYSPNAGRTWRLKFTGHNTPWSIGMDRAGNPYIGTFDTLFRSVDQGITWEPIANSERRRCFAIDTANRIYAAGNGGSVMRSSDAGETWEFLTLRANEQIMALAIDSSNRMYAGTGGGGVYRSTDDGQTWSQFNTGLNKGFFNDYRIASLAVDDNGDVYVGSDDLYRSTSNGWVAIKTDFPAASIVALGNGQLVVQSRNLLYRSMDRGETWTVIDGVSGRAQIALSSTDTLYAGGAPTLRSTDRGLTWQEFTSPLRNRTVTLLGAPIHGYVLAATDEGLFRTTEFGRIWEQTGAGLLTDRMTAFAGSPTGVFFVGSGSIMARSLDSGQTWQRIRRSDTDSGVSSLALDHNGTLLGANGSEWIARSVDSGTTWTEVQSLPTGTKVRHLAIDTAGACYALGEDGILYCSIDAGGSWLERGPAGETATCLASSSRMGLVVGTATQRVFRSIDQGVTWQEHSTGLGGGAVHTIAVDTAGRLLAGTDHGVFWTQSRGGVWSRLGERLPDAPVRSLAISINTAPFAAPDNQGVYRMLSNTSNVEGRSKPPMSRNEFSIVPNPSSAETLITFRVGQRSQVHIQLVTLQGRLVATMGGDYYEPGAHYIAVNTGEIPGGHYAVKLHIGGTVHTQLLHVIH